MIYKRKQLDIFTNKRVRDGLQDTENISLRYSEAIIHLLINKYINYFTMSVQRQRSISSIFSCISEALALNLRRSKC